MSRTPGPNPQIPEFTVQMHHPDRIAEQVAAEAERLAAADRPAPRRRARKPSTRKVAE